jgi:hypothetical protein
MDESMPILILGAGELGMAMLKAFARANHAAARPDITVLLRPSTAQLPRHNAKVAPIYNLPMSVKILARDLAASGQLELAEVFKPYRIIIGCTGYDQKGSGSEVGMQMKIARAIFEAGTVKLYIPWQFGVDYDRFEMGTAGGLFDEQKGVRSFLREMTKAGKIETKWIIISTGIFMSFLFEDFWGVVQQDNTEGFVINALGSWDTTTTVTTSSDIGRLTREVVLAALKTTPEAVALHNRPVFVAGDSITYSELFEAIKDTTQLPVRKGSVWDMKTLEEKMSKNPDDILSKYRFAFGRGVGVSWRMSATFNSQHGIRAQGLRDWLTETRVLSSK